jgi:XTP/dITP diphosphohydrolase
VEFGEKDVSNSIIMSVKIVFASSNQHKIDEIKALLPEGFELLSSAEAGFTEDVEETGKTFEENAAIKANALFDACGMICFSDDSGLEAEALKKAPGVRSARYAGEPADTAKNNALLLENLKDQTNRKARFVTVICLRMPHKTFFFEGFIEGEIAHEARGNNGFGYDPLFIPKGSDKTFAEMDSETKNSMSHRHNALVKMLPFLAFVRE